MTGPKAIFLDFDGTYADHGVVPTAHAEAVTRARAAGHLVFLCTGRPKPMLPARVTSVGFDGLVAAAGGYVEIDGEVVTDHRFPKELSAKVIDQLDRRDGVYLLESPEAIMAPPGTKDRLQHILLRVLRSGEDGSAQGARDIMNRVVETDDLSDCSFSKVTCFKADGSMSELADQIGPSIAMIPSSLNGLGDGSGELYLPEINKAVGIKAVLQHLGLDRNDVIAIGDGHNDLEMIEFAGLGIAVHGAPPEVAAVADLMIAGPTGEGVAQVFAELGLFTAVAGTPAG